MLGPWCRNVFRACHEVASLHAGLKSGVQCSTLATTRMCTEVLRVAVETVVGLTFRVAARVICRLGAARILVET
jgi:hypothetical protein